MTTKTELRRLRELEILTQLAKFGILTVSQMQGLNVAGFGSSGRRNVLRVLREMEEDGHIVSKHVGKKLFAMPGSRFGLWEHRELLVDFLLWKGWADNCHVERPIMHNGVEVIRPDAVVTTSNGLLCIEVDRRQKLSVNKQKVLTYKELGLRMIAVCYRGRGHHFEGCVREYIEDWRC